jgi:hypothetical protein
MLTAEFNDFQFCDRNALFQNNDCFDDLAPVFIGYYYDGSFRDGRIFVEYILDLARINVDTS